MELNILRADPAGNITIFVLDQVGKGTARGHRGEDHGDSGAQGRAGRLCLPCGR